MRISLFATLPLVAALALAPIRGSAQDIVRIRLGAPILVTHYSVDAYGAWRRACTGRRRPALVYGFWNRTSMTAAPSFRGSDAPKFTPFAKSRSTA